LLTRNRRSGDRSDSGTAARPGGSSRLAGRRLSSLRPVALRGNQPATHLAGLVGFRRFRASRQCRRPGRKGNHPGRLDRPSPVLMRPERPGCRGLHHRIGNQAAQSSAAVAWQPDLVRATARSTSSSLLRFVSLSIGFCQAEPAQLRGRPAISTWWVRTPGNPGPSPSLPMRERKRIRPPQSPGA